MHSVVAFVFHTVQLGNANRSKSNARLFSVQAATERRCARSVGLRSSDHNLLHVVHVRGPDLDDLVRHHEQAPRAEEAGQVAQILDCQLRVSNSSSKKILTLEEEKETATAATNSNIVRVDHNHHWQQRRSQWKNKS